MESGGIGKVIFLHFLNHQRGWVAIALLVFNVLAVLVIIINFLEMSPPIMCVMTCAIGKDRAT